MLRQLWLLPWFLLLVLPRPLAAAELILNEYNAVNGLNYLNGGDLVMDALKPHPTCIISGIIHQNPYHEDPESFLEELRARESTPLA